MSPGEPAFFGIGVHATMCLRKRLWYLRNCILCNFCVCVCVCGSVCSCLYLCGCMHTRVSANLIACLSVMAGDCLGGVDACQILTISLLEYSVVCISTMYLIS